MTTSTTHHTFCRICENLCGLQVTVEDGRITEVRPDRDHVATGGFACTKGIKQSRMYSSEDRLTAPMKRVGDDFVEATWEEALADIGARVKAITGEHHPDAVAMYIGTAAGFSILHPIFAKGFMDGLGSRSLYSTATQDCANKFAVATELYGFPFLQPFPDLDHVECLIIVGANPVVSKWSFLQVPNPFKTLKALTARGCRVVVVDPRRTETARAAGEHHFIRPGTDVFFYAAFLHELLRTDGVDREVLARHGRDFEVVEALVDAWTPERAAEVTGIAADTLRELVAAFREADGAVLYSSTGVNMSGWGSVAFWLQEVIHLASGNLDRRGGVLVGKGIFDFPAFAAKRGILMGEERSRIGGFRKVNDAFPGGILADEILEPGERQVRALFVTGGNPLLAMPHAGRLREALRALDLLVVVDLFLNETASEADWVLPAVSPFQRHDLPFVFPLFLGLQRRPYLQATEPVLPPRGGQRDEATIYLDLARACGVGLFGSKVAGATLQSWRALHRARTGHDGLPNRAVLDLMLRVTGHGGFGSLLQHTHGRLREDHEPGSFLGERVLTDDGRVHCAPPPLVERFAELDALHARERAAAGDGFKLIGKRHLTTHNTWTHNLDDFVKHHDYTNACHLHPDDAARLGVGEGDLVDVEGPAATLRLPATLTDELMPGVVAVPHGWGHQHAKGLSVARRTRGVNVNLLFADGPDAIEPLSGMAHLTGVPVKVRAAEGPRADTWSGLPEVDQRSRRAAR